MPALLHEPVRDRAGGEGVNGLVQQIDDLLVRRPRPGRRAHAGRVLQRLVVGQPEMKRYRAAILAAHVALDSLQPGL